MMMFDPRDWEIETEIETGSDDFIFGNYVDWESFRNEHEEELLEYFDINLPWDEILTLKDYIDFASQDVFLKNNLFQKYLEDDLLIENADSLSKGVPIKFIERNNAVSDELISGIFDYYGVPSGTEYEYELPEYLRYWQDFDFDYADYRKYPVKVEKYEETIGYIFQNISSVEDELIKKSLILSSLIITESMFKSVIVDKIPQENMISKFAQEILDLEISKTLRGNIENLNKLFNRLYGVKAPEQKWISLRNSLAHDIEESSIVNGEIVYLNLKRDEKEKYSILKLKKDLIDFCEALKDIIST